MPPAIQSSIRAIWPARVKLKSSLLLALTCCLFSGPPFARGADDPVGVHLSGHLADKEPDGQTRYFEIVMEGYDRYLREEWAESPDVTNNPGDVSCQEVVLIMDGRGGTMIEGAKGELKMPAKYFQEPGRRLWVGDKFLGVAPGDLRELVGYDGYAIEEFSSPISATNFPCPATIKWAGISFQSRPNATYIIDHVAFTRQSESEIFERAREKYFRPAPGSSPAELIAKNALAVAKTDPDAAAASLEAALVKFPPRRRHWVLNQSVLLGALWQIRGLAAKDELVDWFYRTQQNAPVRGNGDHGPVCLLSAVAAAKRPDADQLYAALVADPRFDDTDGRSLTKLCHLTEEGFPIPVGAPIPNGATTQDTSPNFSEANIPRDWLPLWRNQLRRHFGLLEPASSARGANDPVGVHLAGHLAGAGPNGQITRFEIYMEGHDQYYGKEWSGPQDFAYGSPHVSTDPQVVSSCQVELIMGETGGIMGHWRGHLMDEGGPGVMDRPGKYMLEVGRRLWRGDKFQGVCPENLREAMGQPGFQIEEYSTPISASNFPRGCTITWTDLAQPAPNNAATYVIDTVEFTHQPNPRIFLEAREKYFRPSPLLSPDEEVAEAALNEAKVNPADAVARLQAGLTQSPTNRFWYSPNQSLLVGALWQIRGMAAKDQLVNWFYTTRNRTSFHGDSDLTPLNILEAVNEAGRSETSQLLAALVADPRFDETDVPTVGKILDMSDEGYPIPIGAAIAGPGVDLDHRRFPSDWLPLWRNHLRRHYGLPEE